jgi:hypothetical protein
MKDNWITPAHSKPTIFPPNMPATKKSIDAPAIPKAKYLVI